MKKETKKRTDIQKITITRNSGNELKQFNGAV